jgi:hypothetical protein
LEKEEIGLKKLQRILFIKRSEKKVMNEFNNKAPSALGDGDLHNGLIV